MKRLLVLCVTALLAVAIYATTAAGTQQAVTPGQFNALKKQVTKIRKDLNTTIGILGGCVMGNVVPITRYPTSAGSGYLYSPDGTNIILTSALDVTNQGGTPNGYALLVSPDPNCINLINSTLLNLSNAKHTFKAAPAPAFLRVAKSK
jgi:hypothetical protein